MRPMGDDDHPREVVPIENDLSELHVLPRVSGPTLHEDGPGGYAARRRPTRERVSIVTAVARPRKHETVNATFSKQLDGTNGTRAGIPTRNERNLRASFSGKGQSSRRSYDQPDIVAPHGETHGDEHRAQRPPPPTSPGRGSGRDIGGRKTYHCSMIALLLLFAQTAPPPADGELSELRAEVRRLSASMAELRDAQGIHADDHIPDGGDLADAFEAIQKSPRCGAGEGRRGCRIMLGRRRYPIERPILICRQLVVVGRGGWGGAMNTAIVARGQTAFHVARGALCEAAGFEEGSGGWTTIEHVVLRDRGPDSKEAKKGPIRSAGVWMEARAHLDHVWIDGFTQGVRIHAGAKRKPGKTKDGGWAYHAETNANGWSLSHVRITHSRHSGVFVDGPDTNAGLALNVTASSNCRDADRYESLGWRSCANFYDSSFLGNTWIAPHSASVTDKRGNVHHQYLTDSANARNVFIGAYAEENNGPSRASKNDVVVGGLGAWDRGSKGVVLRDGEVNGLCSTASGGDGQLCMGHFAGSGAIQFRAKRLPTVRLRVDRTAGHEGWRFDLNNLNRGVLGRISREGRWSGAALPPCPERARPLRIEGSADVGYVRDGHGSVRLCGLPEASR